MEFTKDIYLNTDKLYENSSLVLLYNGILSKNPDAKVYLRYGYNDSWDNSDELRLKRTDSGMLGVLRISAGKNFNFVFRNNNNEWDNNNNSNYIIPILEKEDVVLEFGPSEVEETEEEKETVEEPVTNEDILEPTVIEVDTVEEPKEPVETVETIEKAEPKESTYAVAYSRIPAGTDEFTKECNISESMIEGRTIEKAVEEVDKEFDDLFIESTKASEESNRIVMPDFNFIEDYSFDSHSLVPQEKNSISSGSFFYKFKRTVKLAFIKFIKLVRSALNYNEDKNY